MGPSQPIQPSFSRYSSSSSSWPFFSSSHFCHVLCLLILLRLFRRNKNPHHRRLNIYLRISNVFSDAVRFSVYRAVNDEFYRMWRKAFMTHFKVLTRHLHTLTVDNDEKPSGWWYTGWCSNRPPQKYVTGVTAWALTVSNNEKVITFTDMWKSSWLLYRTHVL